MSIPISNVNPLTDTFESWLDKTNEVSYIISTSAVTAAANTVGSATQGNVSIEGVLSANVIAVANVIRGGTVSTKSTLYVDSDMVVNTSLFTARANVVIENANTNISSGNLIISGASLYITSNVNIRSNTIHVSTAGRLGVNTGNPDATLTVFGTANVAGRSKFLDDVIVSGIIDVANTAYFTNVESTNIIANNITVYNDVQTIGDLTINGLLEVDQGAIVTGGITVGANASFAASATITGNTTISKHLTANTLSLAGAPLAVNSGGTGLSSFFPGVLVASNTTNIRSVDGETNDVMLYNGTSWEAELLPSMAYQNSTSVSITGGSISNLSSLSVSGNIAVSGNVVVSVNIAASGNISASGNIAASGNVTCDQLLPSTSLAVDRGGTGRSSFTNNALLVGNGTSGINSISPGANGTVLQSNGSVWRSVTGDSVVRSSITSTAGNIPIGGFTIGRFGFSQAIGDQRNRRLYQTYNAAITPIPVPYLDSNSQVQLDYINYGTWMITGSVYDATAVGATVLNYLFQRIA